VATSADDEQRRVDDDEQRRVDDEAQRRVDDDEQRRGEGVFVRDGGEVLATCVEPYVAASTSRNGL
jgi:hypothetical protein